MMRFMRWMCAACVSMVIAGSAAATSIVDDFEDMQLDGWTQTTSGGGGSFSVQTHNGSQMARVSHSAAGTWSLSQTFDFDPNDHVSFVMQAVAASAFGAIGGTKNARAGVRISMLNAVNVALGSIGLFDRDSDAAYLLGPNDFDIGNTQQTYDFSMAELLALTGLNASDPISKVRFTFEAYSEYWYGGNIYPNISSSSNVWFDDFTVVPEPGTFVLVSLGLAGLAVQGRRVGGAS